MTPGCVAVCSCRCLLASRHFPLPFPWALSLRRRRCPPHRPLTPSCPPSPSACPILTSHSKGRGDGGHIRGDRPRARGAGLAGSWRRGIWAGHFVGPGNPLTTPCAASGGAAKRPSTVGFSDKTMGDRRVGSGKRRVGKRAPGSALSRAPCARHRGRALAWGCAPLLPILGGAERMMNPRDVCPWNAPPPPAHGWCTEEVGAGGL